MEGPPRYGGEKEFTRMTAPRLTPIDLTRGSGHEHPDLRTDGTLYLVAVGGEWAVGRFTRQWYGLNFKAMAGGVPLQYDTPGSNSSRWEVVYVFEDGYATYEVTARGDPDMDDDEEPYTVRFRYPDDETARREARRIYGEHLVSVKRAGP